MRYGVATSDFRNPKIDCNGTDIYIQKDGINSDFGIFEDPDYFYRDHGSNLSGLKSIIYKHCGTKAHEFKCIENQTRKIT